MYALCKQNECTASGIDIYIKTGKRFIPGFLWSGSRCNVLAGLQSSTPNQTTE